MSLHEKINSRAPIKPTKVTKEDLELADEISRVSTIKELVETFIVEMAEEFTTLIEVSEEANPVATYKQAISTQEEFFNSVHFLQARLLTLLGEIDSEDALELSDPAKQETEGTMDAVLEPGARELPDLKDLDIYGDKEKA